MGIRLFKKFRLFNKVNENREVLPKDPEAAFFVSAFSLLGKLAMADGVLDERERRFVENFINSHLNLSEDRKCQAMKLFDRAPNDGRNAKDYAEHIRSVFPKSFQIRETLLDVLMTVSLVDEVLDPSENEMLMGIADGFGISFEQFEQIKARHLTARILPQESRFYEILDCSSECSDEELLEAHRKLTTDYDPDKIIASGVPYDFILVARKKLEDIEEAFNVICVRRGMELSPE